MITAKEAKKKVDDAYDINNSLDRIEKSINAAIGLDRYGISVVLSQAENNNSKSLIKILEGHGYRTATDFGRLIISWNNP